MNPIQCRLRLLLTHVLALAAILFGQSHSGYAQEINTQTIQAGTCQVKIFTDPAGNVRIFVTDEKLNIFKSASIDAGTGGKICISKQLRGLNVNQLASVRSQLKLAWDGSKTKHREEAIRATYQALNEIEGRVKTADVPAATATN